MECKNIPTQVLLLARQWFLLQSNSAEIDSKFAGLAKKCIRDVDKELWYRLISNETPWGSMTDANSDLPLQIFKDENFKQTLEKLVRSNDNADE